MPKIKYLRKRFKSNALEVIKKANEIILAYEQQGFELTLRQLYYQFVARGLLPNSMKSYKNLGSVINDARLAGLIDWFHISDRTRFVRSNSHWRTGADILRSASEGFKVDMWEDQEHRPEVWIEKDALVGVIDSACRVLDVPFLSCRGYTSQSEMWASAMRIKRTIDEGQTPVILHFGDHDPSGKDMTRDIIDRLKLFMGGLEVKRLALNMDQVAKYGCPPNPAKITDSRADAYIAEFGRDSWELDALEPQVIKNLMIKTVESYIDREKWDEKLKFVKEEKAKLEKVAKNWK